MRYYFDKAHGMGMPNGSIRYLTGAPFRSLAAVGNCPCADGRRRMVYATGEPDTFFSVPAATRVKGKWVSGFLTMEGTASGSEGYIFQHYRHRKNGALIDESGAADMRIAQRFARREMSWERSPAQWVRMTFPHDFLL